MRDFIPGENGCQQIRQVKSTKRRYCQVKNADDVFFLFLRHTPRMRTSVSRYHRHYFPAEIISHCVWLYFRFDLTFRDVEEMLAMRGVSLSYETVQRMEP
jgi:putative transposase